MSRTEDLAYVEEQLKNFMGERQKIATDYESYNKRISAQIEKILREAGVWDVVNALESGRDTRRTSDQERVNQVGTQIADLEKVRAFLVAREAAEAPVKTPVKEVSEKETPAVPSDGAQDVVPSDMGP